MPSAGVWWRGSTIWVIAAGTMHSRRQLQKMIVDALDEDQRVKNTPSINHTVKNFGTNHGSARKWSYHPNSLPLVIYKRSSTVRGQYHSHKNIWRKRTFIQRKNQSHGPGEDCCWANESGAFPREYSLRSVAASVKGSIQSWSSLLLLQRLIMIRRTLFPPILLEQRTTTRSPHW